MVPESATISQKVDIRINHVAVIELIENELKKALSSSQGTIFEMTSHIFSAGGKRIRPLLVFYSGLIFGKQVLPELVQAAVSVELVHMASLVHDDIIDKSTLRRNKPSVNAIWGNQTAVLGGDFLFAKAFSLLANNHLIRNLELMVEAIQSMCHGEIIQAEDRFKLELGLERYYERIAKKTAILLQCACKSGAIVGGADEHQIEQLGEYGLNLGYSFQIVDDILDFCGDSQLMGKPKREDLIQGNLTLPILLLLQNQQHQKWIEDIIINKDFTQENLSQIETVLKETGIITRSFDIALSHIEKAKINLYSLPDSSARIFLNDLAEQLKTRAY